jgi:hypothetical protein
MESDLINDGIEIPKDYKNIFGENAFYLFKYKKENNEFEKFVEKEEKEIKDELVYFYNKVYEYHQIDKKAIIEKLIEYIDEKKEIEYDKEFLENIPSNYIIIYRKKNEESNKFYYSFDYCFPLIKNILKKMIKNTFFIDIKNPLFYKLSDAAMSINFDEFINFYFENQESFFGYKSHEIEKTYDEYCLEKNSVDEYGEQLFLFIDVIDVLDENLSDRYLRLKEKYMNRELIKNKKIIIVFQDFHGKFVDILFIVKNDNQDKYSIVNLQIKLSDTFSVTKKDKILQKYQMTYLKEKYQFIFGITITNSYIIYLSLFELPKKFAEKNKDKCIFYSKETEKLVDKDKNELTKFPFLEKSEVELISDLEIFTYLLLRHLEGFYQNKKLKLKRIYDNAIEENFMKINILENEIKTEIKYLNKKIFLTHPNQYKLTKENIYYKIREKKIKK